jgi:hypothetical protein
MNRAGPIGTLTPRVVAVPAEDLVARLAHDPGAGSVELGFRPGLLCATLAELSEERIMRDVIACLWATHLGLSETRDANASACLAALVDVVGRLVDIAEQIHRCLDATWAIDPDGVAVGYLPPSAPVAAVCLLPRDVQLRPYPQDRASHDLDATRAALWPALDPLVGAWCRDGRLDIDTTNRVLGRPTSASA